MHFLRTAPLQGRTFVKREPGDQVSNLDRQGIRQHRRLHREFLEPHRHDTKLRCWFYLYDIPAADRFGGSEEGGPDFEVGGRPAAPHEAPAERPLPEDPASRQRIPRGTHPVSYHPHQGASYFSVFTYRSVPLFLPSPKSFQRNKVC